MLIEIRCDKFMDSGKVRPPITFEKGLNTILGASRASNSIGKSTFLMIIDFVFGGKDYVTLNNDVERNIGIHEIKFTSLDKGIQPIVKCDGSLKVRFSTQWRHIHPWRGFEK